MDFIIDENTDIYDIKILYCDVNITGRLDRRYNYLIITVNEIIQICIPITKKGEKYEDLLRFTGHWNCWFRHINAERLNYEVNNADQLNYKVKLLEKILQIEYKNHDQFIEYLHTEKYIDGELQNHQRRQNTKLLSKIINYFNSGRMYLNIVETNHYYQHKNPRGEIMNGLLPESYSIFEIQLFTNKQNKINTYKIFCDKNELINTLRKKQKNKKYKVLNFGSSHYYYQGQKREYCLLEEIDDDIKNLIDSDLIELNVLDKINKSINSDIKKEEQKLYIDL